MKRLLLIVLLFSPLTTGCAPPPTIVTEPGKVAFKADQVLVRVHEVESAAIQANRDGGLNDAETRVIVEYAVASAKVLGETPAGWQATVKALWRQAAPKIHTNNPAVQLALTALTGVLGAL